MNNKRYHFIGIGGISMSSLAFYLKKLGYYVQGSDICKNNIIKVLEENDILVFNKHSKTNIKNIDVVVYSCAINQLNEELMEAKKQNIKIISRAELLANIATQFKTVISVSGSHGKTTTTKMIYNTLKCCGYNPTLHIGGTINDNLGIIVGDKKFFITEACEYNNSFLALKSDIGVVLNIEKEHMDFFKNYKNLKKSFIKFVKNSKKVVFFDNFAKKEDNFITFGFNNKTIEAKNIKEKFGKYSFDCFVLNKFFCNIKLNVYGKHNIQNALAVVGVCKFLGVDKQIIQKGLSMPIDINRRFETICKNDKAVIVHDYAHHPTEIQNTINTFKQLNDNKTVIVFQPHTYSRTQTLFDDFLRVLKKEENVVIVKTFSAREKFDKNGSAFTLFKSLKQNNKNCFYVANFDILKQKVLNYFNKGYNVLILGAGDIYDVCKDIKKEYQKFV